MASVCNGADLGVLRRVVHELGGGGGEQQQQLLLLLIGIFRINIHSIIPNNDDSVGVFVVVGYECVQCGCQ